MGIWDSITGLFGGGKPGPGGKPPNTSGGSRSLNFGYGVLNPIQEPDIFTAYEPGATSGVDTLKNLSEERYTVNTMQSLGQFKAVCLRVDGLFGEVADSWLPTFLEDEKAELLIAVKARIPEIHSFLPNPFQVSQGAQEVVIDQMLVDMHPTFIAINGAVDIPAPGDIVNVDFGNRVNMTDPKYYGVVFSEPLGLNISVVAGGAAGAFGGFPAGKLQTDSEGRALHHVEKCDIKSISCPGGVCKPGSAQRLSAETKAFFKILEEEAKRMGIWLKVTSGYRSAKDQARIMYNNFWGFQGRAGPGARERYLKKLYSSKSFPNVGKIVELYESAPKTTSSKSVQNRVKAQAAQIIDQTWKPLGHRTGTAFDMSFYTWEDGKQCKKGQGTKNEGLVGQALRQAAARSNIRILREKDHFHVSLTPGKASSWAIFKG